MDWISGGRMVSVAVCKSPGVAVIFAVVCARTGTVPTL